MKPTARIAVALLLLCGAFLSGCQSNDNGKPADVTTPEESVSSPESTTEPTNIVELPVQIPELPEEYRELLALRSRVFAYVDQHPMEVGHAAPQYHDDYLKACADACGTDDIDLISDLLFTVETEQWYQNGDSYLYPDGTGLSDIKTGYALFDMNGDGKDELILMTENHSVFAICTQSDGKFVFLHDLFTMFTHIELTVIEGGIIYYHAETSDCSYQVYKKLNANGSLNLVFCVNQGFRDWYKGELLLDSDEYEKAVLYYLQSGDRDKYEISSEEYRVIATRTRIRRDQFKNANTDLIFVPFSQQAS